MARPDLRAALGKHGAMFGKHARCRRRARIGLVDREQMTMRQNSRLGAVKNSRTMSPAQCSRRNQTDHAPMGGVDGDGRMQEQATIAVIAGAPEAALADGMAWKVEFGRILDGQHMAPCRTLASIAPRGGQHLGVADRAVVEEAAERELLIAVFRQDMDTRRGLLSHCVQQPRADTAQAGHHQSSRDRPEPRESSPKSSGGTESQLRTEEKSFRTCATAVARLGP